MLQFRLWEEDEKWHQLSKKCLFLKVCSRQNWGEWRWHASLPPICQCLWICHFPTHAFSGPLIWTDELLLPPPSMYSSLILWDWVVTLGSTGGIPIHLDRTQMLSSCACCLKRRWGLWLQGHLPLKGCATRGLWNKDEVACREQG